jgi:DNA-binding NarL/FixJ family response regulator
VVRGIETASSLVSALGAVRQILIVEDHPVTMMGLRDLISSQKELKVCCEAATGSEALVRVEVETPDLVITCLDLPDRHGLKMIKDLKASKPHVPILVVSTHDEALYAERVLHAGANGYVMKHESVEELVEAIRTVLSGKTYVSPSMSASVLRYFANRGSPEKGSVVAGLTDREFEVFQLLGQGLTTQQIAERLRISPKTVETHRLHAREKLGMTTGPELVRHAVRWAGSQELL